MIRVCAVDDVPVGEGRMVTVAGHGIALFHTVKGWFALDARCPHRGGPLADGIVSDCLVICPLHERRFDLGSGEERSGDARVATHSVRVEGRQVYVEALTSAAASSGPAVVPARASL